MACSVPFDTWQFGVGKEREARPDRVRRGPLRPPLVGPAVRFRAGTGKPSQNYGPWNLSGRGASRSALIPGGSRTAPTDSGEK